MLYKIVISSDKKNARIYFDTHSVNFYHSEGKAYELLDEIVLQPSIRLQARHELANEVTKSIDIDPQLSLFKDVA